MKTVCIDAGRFFSPPQLPQRGRGYPVFIVFFIDEWEAYFWRKLVDMANLVHMNTARQMLSSGNAVDLKFWKEDGSIVHAKNVICTSSFHENNTINIKFLTSKQFRKVRMISIFEINGLEIFI